jgi:hypothetical protein
MHKIERLADENATITTYYSRFFRLGHNHKIVRALRPARRTNTPARSTISIAAPVARLAPGLVPELGRAAPASPVCPSAID